MDSTAHDLAWEEVLRLYAMITARDVGAPYVVAMTSLFSRLRSAAELLDAMPRLSGQ